MKPFLKWAGGKRWLVKALLEKRPLEFNRYCEPFLGSGAFFFELEPTEAIVSDANESLILTYRVIRDQPYKIISGLKKLHRSHSSETYYRIRASQPSNEVDAALRFIYLNRTCWNGLYRVNQKNEFNVPIGTKTAVVFDDDDFMRVAKLLKNVEIQACDFETTISKAKAGDLIYVDPPYTVKHNNNGFVKYNQKMFSWQDQIRLRNSLLIARERGCHIMMSNADHDSVIKLYESFEGKISLARESIIAGSPNARGPTSEILVVHHG